MHARQSQLRGRSRLAGLKEHHAMIGEAMADERPRFARLAGDEAKPQVFSSFNLFPTPEPLAARVAELAEIEPHQNVLEPSAGTGRLVSAVYDAEPTARVYAVEIDRPMCDALEVMDRRCMDFLACDDTVLGLFDRIVMNPPFKNGADIKHIEHARKFLKPGGRLVAICANGPRQHDKLMGEASAWYDLPADSFKGEGTNVSAAIVVLEA